MGLYGAGGSSTQGDNFGVKGTTTGKHSSKRLIVKEDSVNSNNEGSGYAGIGGY